MFSDPTPAAKLLAIVALYWKLLRESDDTFDHESAVARLDALADDILDQLDRAHGPFDQWLPVLAAKGEPKR